MTPVFWRSHPLLDPEFDDEPGEIGFVAGQWPEDPDAMTRAKQDQLRRRMNATTARLRARYRRKCRGCIPYNGSHTPDYWLTGQKDPW